jgi:PAS domain S-box-containing protein
VDANPSACELFEASAEELKGSDPVQLSPAVQPDGQSSADAARARIDNALGGGVPNFEWMHRTRGGREVCCAVRLVRLPSERRRLVCGSLVDVTERRCLEEQVREGRRMEALGRLSAGITHDFNNVLTMVTGSATMILQSSDCAGIRTDAEAIVRASQHGSALTSQVLAFARRNSTGTRVLDLNDVIREMVDLLRVALGEGIALVARLDPDSAPVRLNRNQAEQILVNLVTNARDAMPTRVGSITISTRRSGSSTSLRVADTGGGMSEDVRDRIFEPFFTTRKESGGTGLGLATVHAIVTGAAGSIAVESAMGVGSAFEIVLPAGGSEGLSC